MELLIPTRAVAIENNKTGIIFCDGTGSDSTAKVQKIETGSDEFTTDVTSKQMMVHC